MEPSFGADLSAHLVLQLRDIEILVQQQAETLEAEGKEDATLKQIQAILYSTEVRPASLH